MPDNILPSPLGKVAERTYAQTDEVDRRSISPRKAMLRRSVEIAQKCFAFSRLFDWFIFVAMLCIAFAFFADFIESASRLCLELCHLLKKVDENFNFPSFPVKIKKEREFYHDLF
ncbi:MAG: hypothetical protein Q4C42_00210 [Clostridia bacterium]|nr:hypothetical protein [Clostridia bacterium]